MERKNLIPHQGEAYLFTQFWLPSEATLLMEDLLHNVPWKQDPIKIFGKEVLQPRLTCWFGDPGIDYSYSGITMRSETWNEPLLTIKNKIEPVAGVRFTGALLNLYRNGQDSMGWHRDNERELGKNPVIGSVSLGETRRFQFRNYESKKELISIDLSHGSFLLMRGETQHFWEHRIPKTAIVTQRRINITFRII